MNQQLLFQRTRGSQPARTRLPYAGNENHVRQEDGFAGRGSCAHRFGTIDIAQYFALAADDRALLFGTSLVRSC